MSNVNCFLRWYLILFLAGLLLACAWVCHAATPGMPDAEALLKQSDHFRNGWPSYVVHVKITDYEADRPDEEHLYEVSQKGTDKTYVEFMSPREKGEHLLMLGDDMWVYLPDTSRPVRITPLERLTRRRLKRRRGPHQLCRRLLAGLPAHGEGRSGGV